jgi:Protein of unknown function (DUF1569)
LYRAALNFTYTELIPNIFFEVEVSMTPSFYDPTSLNDLRNRIGRLRPDSQRQWGKMTVAQMAAHCSGMMQIALGEINPPRMLIGRLFGRFIKPGALGEKPFAKNLPTIPGMAVTDDRNFEKERDRLRGLVDRFAAAGPKGCTTHPHAVFGNLTPEEWSLITYKHTDHHLRQFSV